MIIGKQKDFNIIWDMIKSYKKIFIFGCNTCAAVCHEGGNKEAEILASLLRIKAIQETCEIEIVGGGIERQCEHEFFASAAEKINWADAVLSIACGAGVQFTAEKFPHKVIIPGFNTTFIGVVDAPGVFTERCVMCGDCILDKTGGLCPITRCAKSLQNGPCGGSNKGNCEISDKIVCIWDQIVKKLISQGRIDDLLEIKKPKNWKYSWNGGPRKMIKEGAVDNE